MPKCNIFWFFARTHILKTHQKLSPKITICIQLLAGEISPTSFPTSKPPFPSLSESPFPCRFPFPLPPLRGVIRKRREQPEFGSGFWIWVRFLGSSLSSSSSSVPRGHHYSEFSLLFCSSAAFLSVRSQSPLALALALTLPL